MNNFEGDKVPGWLIEAFDARTFLPHGPLDRFPVPLEGEITGGRALVPKSGSPARYIVTIACNETIDEALRFLTEYLPLSGYVLCGEGRMQAKRNFFGKRKNRPNELLLIRRPPFIGTILLRPKDEGIGTYIEADVAHPHHPDIRGIVDFSNPHANPEVHWRNLNGF